ncbi:MAG: rod shape-determining protein MreC [bacterium]|nr:rod shape-determining protein MreC [bacterium]
MNFIRDIGGLIGKAKGSIEDGIQFVYLFLQKQSRLAERNSRLEIEVAKMKIERDVLNNQIKTLKQLEISSGFKESNTKFNLIGAKVIRREPSQWLNTILLDRGKIDGVKSNMAVINENGLVGKIISVSDYTSRVLFILDPGNTVSVKVLRNNVMGVLKGNGDGTCSLQYISTGADIKVGDIIVTSEASELYPSGIVVGKISNIYNRPGETFLDITVVPSVDFSSIYYLWIAK